MTDDIVTRLRVTTVADAAEHIYQTMADAADEIERLRKEYNHASLQLNIMRNIAMGPYGDSSSVIEELMKDRDKWRRIALDEHAGWCQLHHAGSCEEYIVQQQVLRDE